MLMQLAIGQGKAVVLWQLQFGCMKGGKVSLLNIMYGYARKECMISRALCMETGSEGRS